MATLYFIIWMCALWSTNNNSTGLTVLCFIGWLNALGT